MRQTPFVVLLLLRDFSVPSEQVCLLSDNLRALPPPRRPLDPTRKQGKESL